MTRSRPGLQRFAMRRFVERLPIRSGYRLDVNTSRASDADESLSDMLAVSRFGGGPTLDPEQSWPICWGCSEPCTFVAQLHLPPKQPGDDPRLCAIFYCFECQSSGSASTGPGGDFPDLGGWAVLCSAVPRPGQAPVAQPPSRPPRAIRPARVDHRAGTFLPDVSDLLVWAGEREPSRWFGPRPALQTASAHRELAREVLSWCREQNPARWWLIYRQLQRLGQGDALGDETYFSRLFGYPSWIQLYLPHFCDVCGREKTLLAQLHSKPEIGLAWRADDWGCLFVFECEAHPDQVSIYVDHSD